MRASRIIRRDRSQAMVIRGNKILLVKHHMSGRKFFCLPGGGIEEGETPEEAAVRELKEESGVEGRIIRKLSIQFKPDNRGEVHTFLIRIPEDAVPSKGSDPELSQEERAASARRRSACSGTSPSRRTRPRSPRRCWPSWPNTAGRSSRTSAPFPSAPCGGRDRRARR